jgi:hypothetical protein
MHQNTISVGKFLVTPLTRQTDHGDYAASVSLRRGAHDRVFRFVPRFQSPVTAARYAEAEGRRLAMQN